jgi:tRNA pseudouridine55 synthase
MFFFVDKPIWMTSFDVIRYLRKSLGIRKFWHLGTLDPLASWWLLIACDKSTKLIPLLEKSEKTYFFTVDISGSSASLDGGTDIEPVSLESIVMGSQEDLRVYLSSQTRQIPPSYSALHIGGERAYKLAREDKDVVLPMRDITVWWVEIVSFAPPVFSIRLRISSWWYIRSFAPLIGEFFWVKWGYISMLRREILHLPSGDLDISEARDMTSLTREDTLSYEQLFSHIPSEYILDEVYQDLLCGREISPKRLKKEYKYWQKVLLIYENIFYSLVENQDGRFVIIKNDV